MGPWTPGLKAGRSSIIQSGGLTMTRMILSARVGADGVLHVPLGEKEANREVRVTIELAGSPAPQSRQDYLDFLQATAGAWQGEFERPERGTYGLRDHLE